MKRTSIATVLVVAVIGLVLGYLVELVLTRAASQPLLVPPLTYAITLAALGVIVVVLAWPVRRAVHAKDATHIDPFRSARIAALAKACSVAGALLAGTGLGILVFLLTLTLIAESAAVWYTLASLVGALMLLAGGLVAEAFCTLPPPSDGDATEAPQGARSH
ncbi:DUF3180 domain-containing protein [Gryllotalpicola sp.]|uniref:DUF3180 domain-containing protein n=1 Tax=Gryllotalpicola sp. TaxID=1932787 RepID=UPI00262FE0D9|nr:DUF3180 domain-containing protein [Gryllotalpicola sp.]